MQSRMTVKGRLRTGGVIGKFNDHCVYALISCLEEAFKDRWRRIRLTRSLERILGIKDGEEHMETVEPAQAAHD